MFKCFNRKDSYPNEQFLYVICNYPYIVLPGMNDSYSDDWSRPGEVCFPGSPAAVDQLDLGIGYSGLDWIRDGDLPMIRY
jgi:hypothetical protein